MNAVYTISYIIFSVFFTLFMCEIGLALITLFDYNSYKDKINRIINPLWEVTGTFGVFYLVNFEVSYPGILTIVGTAYAIPLLVAAVFIILRNMFLVFSEYINEKNAESRFRLVYSASTIVAALIALSVLTSGISGIGINPTTQSINLEMFLNPFNLLIIVSAIFISFSLASSVIKPEKFFKTGSTSLIAGFALGFLAAYLYLPGVHQPQAISFVLLAFALVIISVILQLMRIKYSGAFNVIIVMVLINILGVLIYPFVFGTTNINSYIASSSLANAEIAITAVGGFLLSISLIIFIYFNYMKK